MIKMLLILLYVFLVCDTIESKKWPIKFTKSESIEYDCYYDTMREYCGVNNKLFLPNGRWSIKYNTCCEYSQIDCIMEETKCLDNAPKNYCSHTVKTIINTKCNGKCIRYAYTYEEKRIYICISGTFIF